MFDCIANSYCIFLSIAPQSSTEHKIGPKWVTESNLQPSRTAWPLECSCRKQLRWAVLGQELDHCLINNFKINYSARLYYIIINYNARLYYIKINDNGCLRARTEELHHCLINNFKINYSARLYYIIINYNARLYYIIINYNARLYYIIINYNARLYYIKINYNGCLRARTERTAPLPHKQL